jgi:GntR family transcriptional regulator
VLYYSTQAVKSGGAKLIVIDRNNRLPLYVQLKEAIIEKVENGDWIAGEAIPTELELQNTYSLSRTTVRQALGELVSDGILTRIQGKGTYVSEPKLEPTRPDLTGFTQDMSEKGYSVSSRVLDISEQRANETIQKKLQISAYTNVLKIDRIRLVDNLPIGVHNVYLNNSLVPHVRLERYDLSHYSLYEALRTEGVKLGEAEETVEASLADERHAELLGIPKGSPVLMLTRLLNMEDGRPLEYAKMVYRADKYKYSIKLR